MQSSTTQIWKNIIQKINLNSNIIRTGQVPKKKSTRQKYITYITQKINLNPNFIRTGEVLKKKKL